MEIKRVTLYHVVMRLKSPFETSYGKTVDRHCLLVKVEERSGEVGWGESPVDEGPWYSYETISTAMHVLRDYVVPWLLEKRFVEGPGGFLRLSQRARGHRMAKAGVEMALWDLRAKLEGKPLYRLIGGTKNRVDCGISIGIIGDEQRLLKAVAEFLSRGYKRIKIKVKPGWDTRPVELIRREYGEIPLQVDANAAYSLETSRPLRELDKHNLLMIEQPLDYDDLHDHAVLQSRLKTPVCLDESIKSLHDAKTALRLGSCRVINIKPARVGGLIETRLIHDYAQEMGVPVWIGGMLETGIGRAFLVAAATLENVRYPSDIGESSRYWEEDVVEPPWTLEGNGTMRVPERSGIGVDVLEERIERSTRAKILLG
uniref:o-succinylbenzoate synthase n=1 Tax=Fervidicoccus fontis TaxID=683846 RepID=A0A7J3ZKS8_9CREN